MRRRWSSLEVICEERGDVIVRSLSVRSIVFSLSKLMVCFTSFVTLCLLVIPPVGVDGPVL